MAFHCEKINNSEEVLWKKLRRDEGRGREETFALFEFLSSFERTFLEIDESHEII